MDVKKVIANNNIDTYSHLAAWVLDPHPHQLLKDGMVPASFLGIHLPLPTKIKMQTLSGMLKDNAMICTFGCLQSNRDHCRVFQASFKRTDMSSFC